LISARPGLLVSNRICTLGRSGRFRSDVGSMAGTSCSADVPPAARFMSLGRRFTGSSIGKSGLNQDPLELTPGLSSKVVLDAVRFWSPHHRLAASFICRSRADPWPRQVSVPSCRATPARERPTQDTCPLGTGFGTWFPPLGVLLLLDTGLLPAHNRTIYLEGVT
jgi:hypothetical protein